MNKIFHFFGSIHFAISLITVTAIFVVAGTWIEAWSESHQYAASWTYEHPAFMVLLFFFFINILFSALRRWPFQIKHIPFLITHCGLLMIITGTAIKTLYGVQGIMILVEGSGSHELLIPHTHALRVEDRSHDVAYYLLRDPKAPFQLKGFAPHSTESFEYWIKGNQAVIQGLPPFPVYAWKEGGLPISAKASFSQKDPWDLVALKVNDVENAVSALYQQGLEKGKADLNFHVVEGFRNPKVVIEGVSIPLQGNYSLMNERGIDLKHTPTIAFMQDQTRDVHLFFFDPYGRVFHEKFSADQLPTLAVYDEGFAGYHAIANFPYYPQSRSDIEEKVLENLKRELDAADPKMLAPPLQLIYQACGPNYSDSVIDLLRHWDHHETVSIPPLDWTLVDDRIHRGIRWAAHYFQNGGTADQWPLSLTESKDGNTLPLVVQQIISVSAQLPEVNINDDVACLRAYLLAYEIYPSAIAPSYESLEIRPETLSIECPFTFRFHASNPTKKIENNRPIATFQFDHSETITLTYDSTGSGLCMPTENGKYLVRFQPLVKSIPYHVRLRNAKQMTYANSQQPFSYEADLVIGGEEKILSMNHVHETWDGYRFYLSSISPPNETQVKRIQLIVNRDPAKYALTYPGGILVTFGIFLLFWWKPKKKNK